MLVIIIVIVNGHLEFLECDRLSDFLTRDCDERIHLCKQSFFFLF